METTIPECADVAAFATRAGLAVLGPAAWTAPLKVNSPMAAATIMQLAIRDNIFYSSWKEILPDEVSGVCRSDIARTVPDWPRSAARASAWLNSLNSRHFRDLRADEKSRPRKRPSQQRDSCHQNDRRRGAADEALRVCRERSPSFGVKAGAAHHRTDYRSPIIVRRRGRGGRRFFGS
jgi:hypothetical protein